VIVPYDQRALGPHYGALTDLQAGANDHALTGREAVDHGERPVLPKFRDALPDVREEGCGIPQRSKGLGRADPGVVEKL
jgi:hypothetical protein